MSFSVLKLYIITLAYNDLNKTDKVTVNATKYITYTYDVAGILIRKQTYDNSVLQKTTDYVDGFVYENNALMYFPMAEGRVRNNSGTLKYEYIIADNMGNARVSFEDNGSGIALLTQENSYYPYGLTMPGNYTVNNPANNKLYNGGSEWQNDFGGLPEYNNTFYRNYDPALGRFISVDPKADATDDLSSYHYAGNNPILFNDPLGDRYQRVDIMRGYLKPFSPKLAFDRSEGGYSPGAGGMYSPNQANVYRQELENANKFGKAYTTASLKRIFEQFGSLPSGNYYANTDGNIFDISANLPEVEIAALRSGKTPSWWENSQLFIDNSSSRSSVLSNLWNSSITRKIVPDIHTIGLSSNVAAFLGFGTTPVNFTIITRGKEPGIYFTPILNGAAGTGFEMTAGVVFSSGNYTGDPRLIESSFLQGHTFGLSVGLGRGIDGSIGVSYAPVDIEDPFGSKGGFVTSGGQIGIGLEGSPATIVNIQATYQYTPVVKPHCTILELYEKYLEILPCSYHSWYILVFLF